MKNILKLSLMAAVSATVLSAADLPYIAPEAVKPLKIQSKITPGGAVELCHILGKDEALRRLRLGLEKLG